MRLAALRTEVAVAPTDVPSRKPLTHAVTALKYRCDASAGFAGLAGLAGLPVPAAAAAGLSSTVVAAGIGDCTTPSSSRRPATLRLPCIETCLPATATFQVLTSLVPRPRRFNTSSITGNAV